MAEKRQKSIKQARALLSGAKPNHKHRYLLFVVALLLLAAGGFYIYKTYIASQDGARLSTFTTFESRLADADMTGFYKNCVDTVLDGDRVPETCRNSEAIRTTYNLEPRALLTIMAGRMASTARRIAYGDLITQEQYKTCLDRGDCVAVPLIPPELKENPTAQEEKKAQEIAALFSHLVNVGTLTPALCTYMEECRALQKIGIITTEDLAVPSAP